MYVNKIINHWDFFFRLFIDTGKFLFSAAYLTKKKSVIKQTIMIFINLHSYQYEKLGERVLKNIHSKNLTELFMGTKSNSNLLGIGKRPYFNIDVIPYW